MIIGRLTDRPIDRSSRYAPQPSRPHTSRSVAKFIQIQGSTDKFGSPTEPGREIHQASLVFVMMLFVANVDDGEREFEPEFG